MSVQGYEPSLLRQNAISLPLAPPPLPIFKKETAYDDSDGPLLSPFLLLYYLLPNAQ